MKVSIVTPVYNDTRVAGALDSILSQTHDADLEMIVVDGASTDGTLEVLEPYRNSVHSMVSEPDGGIYDAMNKGIRQCTGDVVGILNADDRYHDTHVLEDVVRVFQDSRIDACYGDLVYLNQEGHVVRYWKSGSYYPAKFYFGWMPPHPTFFVRKHVYDQLGGFDLRYPISADYELMLRFILRHGIAVKYINRVLVNMAIGGNSNGSIKNIVNGNFEVFQAWQANNLSFGYLVPIMKPLQKILQFRQRFRAKASN